MVDSDKSNYFYNDIVYKTFKFLWIISLFYPIRIIGYYIPPLKFLNSIPNLFFILIIAGWILSSLYEKDFRNKAYIFFYFYLFILFLSLLNARNTGLARFQFIEYIFLLLKIVLTVSIFGNYKRFNKLISIYYYSIIFVGLLGLFQGGKIPYIPQLDDEDAYGPFLIYGVAFSWFFYLGELKKSKKGLYFLLFVFCVIASAYSIARGAIIALAFLIVYLILNHPYKIKTIIKYTILGTVLIIVLLSFFSETVFVKEVLSIFQEKQQIEQKTGTGASRIFLWNMAMKMFLDHNWLIGVGPHNFGVWLPDYAEIYSDQRVGLVHWGQVAHNDYITSLTETGIMGFGMYIIFILYFLKINKRSRKLLDNIVIETYTKINDSIELQSIINRIQKLKYIGLALKGCLIATLINHFFYALFYYLNYFWLLFILNLVYYEVIKNLSLTELKGNVDVG